MTFMYPVGDGDGFGDGFGFSYGKGISVVHGGEEVKKNLWQLRKWHRRHPQHPETVYIKRVKETHRTNGDQGKNRNSTV